MNHKAIVGHALVLAATLAGVIGMGILYQGISHGNVPELTRGMSLLLVGLWWSGRELGRSMLASRLRRAEQRSHVSDEDGVSRQHASQR